MAGTSKVPTTWHYTLEALDPPIRLATFQCPADCKDLRPGEISLKLFSHNPRHVDAQAVTII